MGMACCTQGLPLLITNIKAPVPTSGGGTLLLPPIPVSLQEFLIPPGVVLFSTDS